MADHRLQDFVGSRDNNYNALRMVCASLVLYSHSFALLYGSARFEPMKASLNLTWGDIAVDVFFVVSGFLIANSFLRRKSIEHYAWARFVRIFPALWVAVIFCVFGVGWYFTT